MSTHKRLSWHRKRRPTKKVKRNWSDHLAVAVFFIFLVCLGLIAG